ncbi:MAG: AHH domain-containing protein [Sphingomonadaceae bacterium]|nr:AHH domain-containing protein [Sphingomonadaceae bacterium]
MIPVNITRSSVFAGLFAVVAQVGFSPHNFVANGVLLPSTEAMAIHTRLPLHRGPHKQYDALIAEGLHMIWDDMRRGSMPDNITVLRLLSEFVGHIRRTLQHDRALRLNRNDPRCLHPPLSALDADILKLGVADLLI